MSIKPGELQLQSLRRGEARRHVTSFECFHSVVSDLVCGMAGGCFRRDYSGPCGSVAPIRALPPAWPHCMTSVTARLSHLSCGISPRTMPFWSTARRMGDDFRRKAVAPIAYTSGVHDHKPCRGRTLRTPPAVNVTTPKNPICGGFLC